MTRLVLSLYIRFISSKLAKPFAISSTFNSISNVSGNQSLSNLKLLEIRETLLIIVEHLYYKNVICKGCDSWKLDCARWEFQNSKLEI